MGNSAGLHLRRRVMLFQHCRRMIDLVRECPGVLGPHISVVLGLLACFSAELEHFLLHVHAVPRKVRSPWHHDA